MGRPVKKLEAKEKSGREADGYVPAAMTKTEAARYYGVNVSTIERGVKAGRIKTIKLNRREMVLRSSIEGAA